MIKLQQIEFGSIAENDFDLVIAASGFEERATFQVRHLPLKKGRKLALGFSTEQDDSVRIENDRIFKEQGFDIEIKDGHESDNDYFKQLVSELIRDLNKDEINIYVDYSSMTRNWYALILLYFEKLAAGKKINIFFSYSFAKYEESKNVDILNKVVEPLFGFCNLSLPIKPTALIICLGNELNRTYGLKEYFDAATFLFYSDPHVNNRYSEEVVSVNEEIIKNTPPDHVFQYPLNNLLMSNFILNNLCNALSENYRVVIAPCGPKPFTLLSLITSLNRNSRIEVWRISPAENIAKYRRVPTGEILTMKASIEN